MKVKDFQKALQDLSPDADLLLWDDRFIDLRGLREPIISHIDTLTHPNTYVISQYEKEVKDNV